MNFVAKVQLLFVILRRIMEKRANFGSKLGIILASAGSAVGLGNVWRFPTEVGENGGAAFILIYILCVILLGVPLMVSEFVIGRHTHKNTADAYQQLAPHSPWVFQGYLGVFTSWFILCYYSVVAGWTLKYLFSALAGQVGTIEDSAAYFTEFTASPWLPLLCMVAVMLMCHWVIARGVQAGIEKYSKLMMPLLLLIITVLVVCSFSMPGSDEGLRFLFKPDFSKIDSSVVLSAMGQAFFSLSIAMGCLCTYASYFRDDAKLVRTAGSVAVIDTTVAIMSGFIIFPAVFSVAEVAPDAGPGLVFITLPNVFQIAMALCCDVLPPVVVGGTDEHDVHPRTHHRLPARALPPPPQHRHVDGHSLLHPHRRALLPQLWSAGGCEVPLRDDVLRLLRLRLGQDFPAPGRHHHLALRGVETRPPTGL